MADFIRVTFVSWILFFGFFNNLIRSEADSQEERKTYIVYMGNKRNDDDSTSNHHKRMLRQVPGSSIPPECLLHSYKRSFNGFVAKLTHDEMQKIAGMDGVVSVFPNEKRHLHTTRSWDFMGFSRNVPRATVESNVIVGVFDTGIWPESPSFPEIYGVGPPPSKWKGSCFATNFTCNNKIIGAKYYRYDGDFPSDDIISPRDVNGHGTHTASTVAGGSVNKASLYGLGIGIARGGVPSARIAVYKICWTDGCYDVDILRAFDDAIADGVDIISLSVGGFRAKSYFNDTIAIGAFHAMMKGILTSNSAGNDGPGRATIRNFSPWSLSVAASTIDRKFFTQVQLGNNNIFQGISKNTFFMGGNMYPLIYAGDAPNTTGGFTSNDSRYCYRNSVDASLVVGKIVLCDRFVPPASTSWLINKAAGIIMQDAGFKDVSYSFPLPASYLGPQDGQNIHLYINQTRNSNPSATIFNSNERNDTNAPYVVSFSSRGPNPITFDILKPDISGPGVDILAAWSPLNSVSGVPGDNRSVPFHIISGTSMSCPHATAVASYVKSFNPTWSPAALKSALMTTANPMRSDLNPDAEFAYGSGHLNPIRALNPGLIYDAGEEDYISFLCGQGYDTRLLQTITSDNNTCSTTNTVAVWDLNYPSFALSTLTIQLSTQVFKRTVTNVGSPISSYKSYVTAPLGLNIRVDPPVLSFTYIGEKLPFTVTINGSINSNLVSASLVWDDGIHSVRSPIVVFLRV